MHGVGTKMVTARRSHLASTKSKTRAALRRRLFSYLQKVTHHAYTQISGGSEPPPAPTGHWDLIGSLALRAAGRGDV
jgi:hypothetical protein